MGLKSLIQQTALLSVRDRQKIRDRNKDNPDIEALLAEGDALRTLLERGSRANKILQNQLDKQITKGKRATQKSKRRLAEARKHKGKS